MWDSAGRRWASKSCRGAGQGDALFPGSACVCPQTRVLAALLDWATHPHGALQGAPCPSRVTPRLSPSSCTPSPPPACSSPTSSTPPPLPPAGSHGLPASEPCPSLVLPDGPQMTRAYPWPCSSITESSPSHHLQKKKAALGPGILGPPASGSSRGPGAHPHTS